MSDHADIVREWIGGCLALHGFREDCPACVAYRDANAALDRLVAERDEALGIELSEVMDDFRAAEAERDIARRERDKALLSVEGLSKRLTIAVAAEARVTELETALTVWQGVSPSHRAECNFLTTQGCTCGLQRARDLTRAALAAPTKEGT